MVTSSIGCLQIRLEAATYQEPDAAASALQESLASERRQTRTIFQTIKPDSLGFVSEPGEAVFPHGAKRFREGEAPAEPLVLAARTARVDLVDSYQEARWSGLVNGVPVTTTRSGLSDMALRLAVNLFGAPPLRGEDFAKYRAATDHETIVGLGLIVQVPSGNYLPDKLLNLGSNRFTFRPQLGITHTQGKWGTELTASSWIYSDNNNFFNGSVLAQDPFYTVQGHVDYTFRPGLWLGAGFGYGVGGESTISGVRKDDLRESVAWLLTFAYPFNRQWGVTFSYLGHRTLTDVGGNSDTLAAAISVLW